MLRAAVFVLLSAGNNKLAKIAMIAMTTSNSMSVKPGFDSHSFPTAMEIGAVLAFADARLFPVASIVRHGVVIR